MKQSNNSSHVEHMKCGVNGSIRSNDISSVLRNMCPLIVIVLQFGITSMFMWMLCEGIRLNNVLTVSVFKNHFKTFSFYILGWGKNQSREICFLISFLYSSSILYYIKLEYYHVD
jgi:hypothetical protein